MNFSCERPAVFYALFLLIPALLYALLSYRRFVFSLVEYNSIQKKSYALHKLHLKFTMRTILRSLSFALLVAAASGISWGTNLVPVQKNGQSISLVFDISYSMEAKDAPGGMSRLESVASYANELLDHLQGTSISVVLAKGNGIIAVPLTEDLEAIRSLLPSLSPLLMTAEGSSLGSGISMAINSFPTQSANSSCIWLFTDGEETDGTLLASLQNAVKYGISVVIVGFGSERESEILAGDGKTVIKTALRSNALEKLIATISKETEKSKHGRESAQVSYIDASEPSSAWKLLHMLQEPSKNGQPAIAYEIKQVSHHTLFIALAIVFFAASFLFSELDFGKRTKRTAILFVLCLAFTSCTPRLKDGEKILKGRLEWNRKHYQQAVVYFLQAADNSERRGDWLCANYALYGLAVTYLMQEEDEAAQQRFEQIAANAPPSVQFAILYNSGIIAHKKGDYALAASCFRNALKIDSSSNNAKINLELSLREDSLQSRAQEQELQPISENSEEHTLEQVLFSIIRENEENQWKNQLQHSEHSARDY